jgi:anaerobic selenocysteine-containing dehydrogenase
MREAVRTICPFCSMGCSLRIRPPSDSPWVGDVESAALDYDADGPFNRGSLCGKGNMSLELLTHAGRLDAPVVTRAGVATSAGWEDALAVLAGGLEDVRREHGPGAIGLVLGPHLSGEEVERALDLAHALGTRNVDGGLPEDRVLLGGIERCCAAPQPVETPDRIAGMTALLVLGDVFTQAPCIARSVLESRYDRRRNVLAVLSSRPTRTAWFGRPALGCRPGSEVAALALLLHAALESAEGDPAALWAGHARRVFGRTAPRVLAEWAGIDVERVGAVVGALMREPESGVVVGFDFGDTERPDLAAGLAAMLAQVTGSRFLPLPAGPNAIGLHRRLAAARKNGACGLTAAEMVESALTGDLKALVGFSCNPLAALPGAVGATAARRLAVFAYTTPFRGDAPDLASVLLPCATWGEKAGTVVNAFGGTQVLGVALPAPGSARSDHAILDLLIERLEPYAAADAGQEIEAAPCEAAAFLGELDIHLRLEQRERGAYEAGTHLLLPEAVASHAADGWLTRHLSWPRHECPRPEVSLNRLDAETLGIAAGDPVRVRSRTGEAVLAARIREGLPAGTVLAPPHEPAVRHLMRWRVDPVLRDLELRPSRVSLEPVRGEVAP